MEERKEKPLIWVSEDQSEFYLSLFDIHEYSFLDDVKITEVMTIVTTLPNGQYGDCYNYFDLNQNIEDSQFEDLIGQTYTHPLQLQSILPYKFYEYDVMLANGIRARTILGGDLYLENSKEIYNFKLLLQQLKVLVRVYKMQPNRLYLLDNKKLLPTQFITKNIVDFVLRNQQIFL